MRAIWIEPEPQESEPLLESGIGGCGGGGIGRGGGLGHRKVRQRRKMDAIRARLRHCGRRGNWWPGNRLRLDLALRMRRRHGRPARHISELHPRAQVRAGQTENLHWMQPQAQDHHPATTACAATDSKVEPTDLRRFGSGENILTLPPILTCLVFGWPSRGGAAYRA